MPNIIPEKGINFSVYLEGAECLGVAEGNFPNLEAMTSEVKGAGVAGVVDSIVLGHFNSITVTLQWRSTTDHFAQLAAHRTFDLDLYAAHQDYDAGLGEYIARPVHVYLKGTPKHSNIGDLVVGDSTNTETELEVPYLKVEIDGKERIVLDKYNYIYRVDGVDYLAGVRSALGKQ